MILGPKCSGLTKNPKKSNFDWQLTFYRTIPNLPFSEGSCDCDVILIWLGHLRVKSVMSLRIFWLFPQIPDLPLYSRWILYCKTLIFDFWGNAFSGLIVNLWMDPRGSFEHIEPYFEVLSQSQMKISSWRLQSIKNPNLDCWGSWDPTVLHLCNLLLDFCS